MTYTGTSERQIKVETYCLWREKKLTIISDKDHKPTKAPVILLNLSIVILVYQIYAYCTSRLFPVHGCKVSVLYCPFCNTSAFINNTYHVQLHHMLLPLTILYAIILTMSYRSSFP